jgi:hypothetical protein
MEWSRLICAGLVCLGLMQELRAEEPSSAQRADSLRMQARRLEERGDWEAARHVRDQASRLDQSLRHWQAQRIEHLERAAQSLVEGGFEQEAEQLRVRAAAMQRELTQAGAPVFPEAALEELRELRQSVNRLTAEIAELRLHLGQIRNSPEPTLAPTADQSAPPYLHRSAEIPNEDLDAPVPGRMNRKIPAGEAAIDLNSGKGGTNAVEFEFELIPLEPTPAREATAPAGSSTVEPQTPSVPAPMPTPVPTPVPASVE